MMPRPAGPSEWTAAVLALALALAFAAPLAAAQGTGRVASAPGDAAGGQKIDAQAWRKLRPGRPLVIAHRGYSEKHADNSRESFEAAIAVGADLIETDIRQSKDGILVCVHDPAVKGDDVADLTAAELAKRSILRLADVLAIAKGRIGVLLDIKLRDDDFPLRVFEEVKHAGMERKVIFGVRRNSQVKALRARASDVVILGFLKNYKRFPAFYRAGGDIARLWEEDVNASNLALARGGAAANAHAVLVTAGHRQSGESPGDITAARFGALTAMGIDAVLVNDPALGLKARGQARK